jgi:hypothetical protein
MGRFADMKEEILPGDSEAQTLFRFCPIEENPLPAERFGFSSGGYSFTYPQIL